MPVGSVAAAAPGGASYRRLPVMQSLRRCAEHTSRLSVSQATFDFKYLKFLALMT
jgi:hypothetical protein